MKTILATCRHSSLSIMVLGTTSMFFIACGPKPDPGPTPIPPWPDSPRLHSNNGTPAAVPNEKIPTRIPRNREGQIELIALAKLRVLVRHEGQEEEIWKELRKDEHLQIPKQGKMMITYSSGKNLRIESNGKVVKPSGGNELVGTITLE